MLIIFEMPDQTYMGWILNSLFLICPLPPHLLHPLVKWNTSILGKVYVCTHNTGCGHDNSLATGQGDDGTGLLGVKCLSSFIPQSHQVLCQAVHSVHPWDTALILSLLNIWIYKNKITTISQAEKYYIFHTVYMSQRTYQFLLWCCWSHGRCPRGTCSCSSGKRG